MTDENRSWPRPYVLDLTQEFLRATYPHEIVFLPAVCDYFRSHDRTLPPAPSSDEIGPISSGLPFATEGGTRLVSPFVLLTVDAVLGELRLRDFTPDLNATQKAVHAAAEAFGASPRLINELVNKIGPRLLAHFKEGSVPQPAAGPKEHATADGTNSDFVIVVRLCEGCNEVQVTECSRAEADTFAKEITYDLVVDEIRHVLLIRPKGEIEECSIGKIGRAVRVLLWTALSHVGITFEYENLYKTIHSSDAPAAPPAPDATYLAALVYQYRDRLQKLLGTGLADTARKVGGNTGKRKAAGKQRRRALGTTVVVRMLKEGGVRTYFVPAEGWTFCWIRRSRSVEQSELLRAR